MEYTAPIRIQPDTVNPAVSRFIFQSRSMMTSNPKALNLEAVNRSKNKVTVGFKCKPLVKLTLAKNAHHIGLTLSQYVERLIDQNEMLQSEWKDKMLKEQERLTQSLKEQEKKTAFYENDLLNAMLERNMGKSVSFTDKKTGSEKHIEIKRLEDVYTVMINSFK